MVTHRCLRRYIQGIATARRKPRFSPFDSATLYSAAYIVCTSVLAPPTLPQHIIHSWVNQQDPPNSSSAARNQLCLAMSCIYARAVY